MAPKVPRSILSTLWVGEDDKTDNHLIRHTKCAILNVHWFNLLYSYIDKNLKQYQLDANILDYDYKNIFDIESVALEVGTSLA